MKQKKLILTALVCSAITAAYSGSIVWAAEAAPKAAVDEYALDDTIVTATRTEKSDLDIPAATVVITGKELKEHGELTVYDALAHVAGINNYSYGNGGEDYGGMNSRINIRGLDKGTLVMLNGTPMNLLSMNSMMSSIPIDAVEKIEIIKGANSVLYGAEALSGVINIITKQTGANGTSVGGEWGNKDSNYFLRTGDENFTVYYKREYRADQHKYTKPYYSSKKYKIGEKENGTKETAFLNYKIDKNWSFNYFYDTVNSQFKVYQANSYNMANRELSKNYIYKSYRQNGQLIYNNPEQQFKGVLAYNKDRFCSYADGTSNFTSQGIDLDLQKTWKIGEQNLLTGGLTVNDEKYDTRYGKKLGGFTRTSLATFVSYTDQVNDRFSTTLGVRGHFVPKNDYDQAQNIFLPQIQTNYKLNKNTSWYTNIGKAFEMPPISNVYSGTSTKVDIHLKPQQGWTYETGIKHITDKDSFKLDIFHMDIEDKFKWVKESTLISGGASSLSVLINQDKFRNTGIEAEYSHKFDDVWKAYWSISYSKPESQTTSGEWVQAEARFQTGVDLTYHKAKLTGNWNCFFIGQRQPCYYRKDGTSTTTYGTDHNVGNSLDMNLSLQYHASKQDTITFGIYNLLDRDNPINEYEYYAVGRNIRVGFVHNF